MLKLEATLIATTAAGPWRGGWSPDRGVDFVVWAPDRQAATPAPETRERIVAGERFSFLDADDIPTAGTTVVRRYVSLSAEADEASARDRADLPLTRAWSALSRKLAGS
jgi:hypothetical protein